MADRTAYEILGVPKDADDLSIRKAYRALALKNHPDRNPSPDATRIMQEINNAYDNIKDASKRTQYDSRLRRTSPSASPSYTRYEPRQRQQREKKPNKKKEARMTEQRHLILYILYREREERPNSAGFPPDVMSEARRKRDGYLYDAFGYSNTKIIEITRTFKASHQRHLLELERNNFMDPEMSKKIMEAKALIHAYDEIIKDARNKELLIINKSWRKQEASRPKPPPRDRKATRPDESKPNAGNRQAKMDFGAMGDDNAQTQNTTSKPNMGYDRPQYDMGSDNPRTAPPRPPRGHPRPPGASRRRFR